MTAQIPRAPSSRSDQIQLTNGPVEFIENRLTADLRPVFGERSVKYIMDLGQFGSEEDEKVLERLELWKGADAEKEKLFQAMEKYEQKAKAKHTTCRSWREIRDTKHTWKGVLDEVQLAAERYENKGKVSGFMRKLQDHADGFEMWMDLIPEGEYTGVICGAFKIALRAASRMSRIRSIMFQTLAAIPEYITTSNRYREIYKTHRSPQLVRKTCELYKSIVVALEEVFEYLQEHSLVKAINAFVLGDAYKKRLEDKLGVIAVAVENVRKEANVRHQEVTQKISQRQDVYEYQRRLDQEKTREEYKQYNESLGRKVDLFDKGLDDRLQRAVVNAFNNALTQLSGSQIYDPLSGGLRLAVLPAMTTGRPESAQIESKLAVARRPENIVRDLGFQTESPLNDLEDRLQLGNVLDVPAQAVAMELIKATQLRHWLASASSEILFVNSNTNVDYVDGPLPMLSAKILDSLQNAEPIFTIHHFCGLHHDVGYENSADARGMMNSLLGQLLTLPSLDFGLSFLTDIDVKNLQRNDLKTLCITVKTLLSQLPMRTALVCVIDSVSCYEDRDRIEDTIKAIRHLVRLARKAQEIPFKLLLTCSGESPYSADYEIEEREILLVDEDLVDDDGQGWNDEALYEDMASSVPDDDANEDPD